MKVVGINGSSRKDGNTAILIKTIFEKLHENGIEKIKEADGLILGSPVYGADISAKMKVFIDRLGIASLGNPDVLKRKPGAAVSAVRRGGGMTTVDTLNHFMLFREMIIVGSTYWNMVYGKDAGDVLNDSEGMANMRNIGENMAWLLKNLHAEQEKER